MKQSTAPLLIVLTICSCPVKADADLMSAARVHPSYHGAVPKRSDVVFSTRFTREEALPLIKAYGATRVEWVYTKDPGFAARLKRQAPWLGGALNANGPLPDGAGYARDFDGKVLTAPWMTGWGVSFVTTTHSDTRKAFEDQTRSYIAMGIDSLQHDDPLLQVYSALNQAGDFNDSTLRSFPKWLAQQTDQAPIRKAGLAGFDGNYRDWLRDQYQVMNAEDYRKRFRGFRSTPLWLSYIRATVLEHHRSVRALASASKGRPVPLSMNLGGLVEPVESNPHFFLAPAADYAIAETPIKDLAALVSTSNTARALGIGFVPSIKPESLPENRVAIAFFYALGDQPLVPWDTYDGNDPQGKPKRFFGMPDDYADLYAFVRANPTLFDKTETTPVVGLVVPVDKGDALAVRALSQRLAAQQVPFAFVPVGGAAGYRVDPARLRHLKLLVKTNPDGDYDTAALQALADSAVPGVIAAELTNGRIAGLRLFQVAPGAERLLLIPRADPADPGRLLVHVVDAGRGDKGSFDPVCQRRVGLRRDALGEAGVTTGRWVQSSGSTSVQPDTTGGSHIFFNLAGCSLWGVLELRLSR